jgi:hypothetical protein
MLFCKAPARCAQSVAPIHAPQVAPGASRRAQQSATDDRALTPRFRRARRESATTCATSAPVASGGMLRTLGRWLARVFASPATRPPEPPVVLPRSVRLAAWRMI